MHMSDLQLRAANWVLRTLGRRELADRRERAHRFFEEATELVQSTGMKRQECHMLVDYTFNRTPGDPPQEFGGVALTLAVYAQSLHLDLGRAASEELLRVEQPEVAAAIARKHAAKPRGTPLPGGASPDAARPPQPPQPPRPDSFYEALGWMHAECCAALERGEDPRNMEVGDMIARAERDCSPRRAELTEAIRNQPGMNDEHDE